MKEKHIWKTDRALNLKKLNERVPDYEADEIILFAAELDVKPGLGNILIDNFYSNIIFSDEPQLEIYSRFGTMVRLLLISTEIEENKFQPFSEFEDLGYYYDRIIFTVGLTKNQCLALDQDLENYEY